MEEENLQLLWRLLSHESAETEMETGGFDTESVDMELLMESAAEGNFDYINAEDLELLMESEGNFDYINVEDLELLMESAGEQYNFEELLMESAGEEYNFDYINAEDLEIVLPAESVFQHRGLPASRSFVENLPLVHLQEADDACGICMEDMLIHEMVKMLPCRHHFHGQCIDPWFELHNTCPVCRYQLPTDNPSEEE